MAPFAPGTWGSLAAIPVCFALSFIPHILSLFFIIIAGWYACYASGIAEEIIQEKDSGMIVIDEIIGMLLTLWAIEPSLLNYILGFIFFRCFDIIKPYPIILADKKVKNGLGVVLDDVLAGIAARVLLWIVIIIWLNIHA